ncbi:NAD(P)/FAD-dependent oxidoreductase [Bradyrhizobium sp. INPA01-394B]|uniref:NAD(P)/FAD-dependent oxidoreductase n=1 Tax=Bradyrhizobium campsiandrae TaxID=1729892 RepID=A0ABR7UI67_9BRAD|nr:NAD(P)/FAD-dependent oxidoreductase [Bradyrhizobium campsiandrae]MBC9876554.1 NAD(P)/FAD-dependent oxidoreductase [Bradyrhizobium campsiandrae]MBC9983674.1 NAD(P)/FAD-dependent oxidoreductase [Bradyrhizobium campsiandrae]
MFQSDADAAARETLRLIGPDPQNWVPDRRGVDHNVAIIGGGQSGSTFAFALRRSGIGKVTVIDAANDAASSGPWLSSARMHKLRTPKNLPGPELGLPGLSFQAWYEARNGAVAYEAVDRISRLDWAAYLDWYRKTLGIEVRYRTRLVRIEPAQDHLRLHLDVAGEARTETTRKVILASGFPSNGGPSIPDVLSRNLPKELYAHTLEAIDFGKLRDKAVAVLGSAASAFDAAGVALEAGARAVHLFARRDRLASEPVIRTRGYPGAYDNYAALPDAVRWHQAIRFRRAGSTPPPDAIARAVKFPNFHLHLAAPWTSAKPFGRRLLATTPQGDIAFDFVIAGTGYQVDLAKRPEVADFANEILLWCDRFTPPAEEQDDGLGAHPYLGAGHEFLEKEPGRAPYLRNIHVFNPAAFVSFGLPVGDVPSFKRDIPGVVARISRDLFLDDLPAHEARINGPIADDFEPSLYTSAIWRSPNIIAAE